MDWILAHIMEVLGVIVLALVVELIWITHGFSWKRRLPVFAIIVAMLAGPFYIIWTGGGVMPPRVPFLAPGPEEAMHCQTTYTFNLTRFKEDDLTNTRCTLEVFAAEGTLHSRRGDQ